LLSKGRFMSDEKKINQTKKLQELVKKRETPLILMEQNQIANMTRRRISSTNYNPDNFSSFDE